MGPGMGVGTLPELLWSSLRNMEKSIQVSHSPMAAGSGSLPKESYMEKGGKCVFLPPNLAKKKFQ